MGGFSRGAFLGGGGGLKKFLGVSNLGLFWRGSRSKYHWGCNKDTLDGILEGILERYSLEGLLERYSLEGILERVTVRGGSSGRLTQPLAAYLTP